MNLHDRTQTYRLDLDADQLRALQLGKQPIQHAGLRPAVHARVDRMPVTKALRATHAIYSRSQRQRESR